MPSSRQNDENSDKEQHVMSQEENVRRALREYYAKNN